MKNTDKIYDDLLDEDFLKDSVLKDFLEKNRLTLQNASNFNTFKELDRFLTMTTTYVRINVESGNYQNAWIMCNKNLSIIERYKESLNIKNDYLYLTSNLFFKSRILYLRNQIKEAIAELDKLLILDPANEKFEAFRQSYQLENNKKLSNRFSWAAIIVFALVIIFSDILGITLRWIFSFIGIGFIVLAYMYSNNTKKLKKTGANKT